MLFTEAHMDPMEKNNVDTQGGIQALVKEDASFPPSLPLSFLSV